MIVAVTYKDGNVFQHFGHTKQVKIYDENIHCEHHEHSCNEHKCNEDKHGCFGNK